MILVDFIQKSEVNMMINADNREQFEETTDITVEIGRKHPRLLDNGGPEEYEDMADLIPVRIVYGAVIA